MEEVSNDNPELKPSGTGYYYYYYYYYYFYLFY